MSVQPSKLISECPMCKSSYEEKEVRLVQEQGTSRLFHCTCRSCGHAMLAVVLEASGMVSSVGVMTDLQAMDAFRFQDAKPITVDECVRAYQALEVRSFAFCQEILRRSVA